MAALTIIELARKLRAEAVDVVNRHQKLASLQLYRVLAGCLEVAELCAASITAERELRALVASEASPGRSRGYVERGSDEYILACRYVLNGESHANLSRYSNALREAKKLQIHSSQLYDWLKNEGGVNGLFLRRPSVHKIINAKLIRFDRSVALPKEGRFTLTLERRLDGVFTVIEEPDEPAQAITLAKVRTVERIPRPEDTDTQVLDGLVGRQSPQEHQA